MKLMLTGFKDGDFLLKANEYNGFGGNGDNVSPALSWQDAPAETKSFALTMYDPDAPTGSGFWHWIAYDIPPTTRGLAAGAGDAQQSAIPAMRQAMTDYGQAGYGGCCPPEGDPAHRYIFTLHALNCETLPVAADTTNAIVRFMIQAHTLCKAEFVTFYQR